MLTSLEEKQLKEAIAQGAVPDEVVREARRLLEQAHKVKWPLSVTDALKRAAATVAKVARPPRGPVGTRIEKDEVDPADLQLLEKIGRSKQAVVYKCMQMSKGRLVAIKILTAQAAANVEARNSFIREGRNAARLIHPNIVRIYGVAPFKDTLLLAMEYVDGGSVADLLAAQQRLDVGEAVRIIRAAAEGLAYAHKQGFIHRDIKPHNILLMKDGQVKVADMGIARRNADLDAAFAEAGRAYGTPYYLSPEQVRGDPDTDFRADIYSLGATFYQMLVGRPPFASPDPQSLYKMHLTAAVPDPRRFVPELPESLFHILEKALAKKPADRFSNCEAFIKALDQTGLVERLQPPAAPPDQGL
jgi:serine/threonine-protein kinase